MALLRLIHAADLPDPATVLAQLASGGVAAAPARGAAPSAPAQGVTNAALPADFPAFIRTIEGKGKILLAQQLHDHVGLVSFAPGELVLKPLKPLGPDFTRDLALAAKEATEQNWQVRLAEERARAAILDEPPVRAILEQFPEAILETVTRKEA